MPADPPDRLRAQGIPACAAWLIVHRQHVVSGSRASLRDPMVLSCQDCLSTTPWGEGEGWGCYRDERAGEWVLMIESLGGEAHGCVMEIGLRSGQARFGITGSAMVERVAEQLRR